MINKEMNLSENQILDYLENQEIEDTETEEFLWKVESYNMECVSVPVRYEVYKSNELVEVLRNVENSVYLQQELKRYENNNEYEVHLIVEEPEMYNYDEFGNMELNVYE